MPFLPLRLASRLAALGTALLVAACGDAPAGKQQAAAPPLPQPKVPVATGTPRILFVGNSHTAYYASIPQQLKELCDFNQVPLDGAVLVEMGISLHEVYAADREDAEALLAQTEPDGNYFDYVVLQEKTPVVVDSAARYAANVKLWTDKIRAHSPGAAIYLYELAAYDEFAADSAGFAASHAAMRGHTLAVLAQVPNAGLYRVGDAVQAAYAGQQGYRYQVGGKDNLRFGDNTQHLLNDGVFMASVLLYETLFNKQPKLPAQLTFSTGASNEDNGRQAPQPISQAVSDPVALGKLAWQYHR